MEERTHGLLARQTADEKRQGTPGGMFPKSFKLNAPSGKNLQKAFGQRTQNSEGDCVACASSPVRFLTASVALVSVCFVGRGNMASTKKSFHCSFNVSLSLCVLKRPHKCHSLHR